MMSSSVMIKKIRRALLLDQKGFAKELKLSSQAISLYETGRRNPRLSVISQLIKLAKKVHLKVTVDDFLE